MLPDEERAHLAALLTHHRWSALATLGETGPLASMVAFAFDADGAVLMHLSRLAAHTRNLLHHPRCSLVISDPDDGRADPQTLARVAIQGEARPFDKDQDSTYPAARAAYLARLPEAAERFGFGDFSLFCLVPAQARFVSGFGRAYTLAAAELQELAARAR